MRLNLKREEEAQENLVVQLYHFQPKKQAFARQLYEPFGFAPDKPCGALE